MIQNPTFKVLFTFQKFGVKSLLIGGQACIVYGAAEFSRDSDLVILCSPENLNKVKKALHALEAENIYLPPFKKECLDKGHACHFRCYSEPVKELRIDIMAKLRGCDHFEKLWERRYTVKLPSGKTIQVIGLEDLVQSKKTQRDKDWLMLNRLVENDMLLTRKPSDKKIEWWLLECRNTDSLLELGKENKELTKRCVEKRPLLKTVLLRNTKKLQDELREEELSERKRDERYWRPLKKELEILRHNLR